MSRTLEQRERRRKLMLRAPGLGLIVVLYAIPMVLIVVYSVLSRGDGVGVEAEFSLDAYRELIRPEERATYYNGYVTVLVDSVLWSLIATVVAFALALPLAVFISSRSSPLVKNALLVAVVIPFWTSMLVRIYAMKFLLARVGPLNNLLESLGLERIAFLNTPQIVVVGLVYTALPFMVLPLYAAVERVDRDVLQAARDLGASPLQVFRTAFLPSIRLGVATGCLLVFVLSVSQFIVPVLLGGGKANMIAVVLEAQFGESRNWPLGAALAVTLVAMTLVGTWLTSRQTEQGAR